MLKKIFALFLILVIMVFAMPLGFAYAQDGKTYVLEVTQSKVFNDFPIEADTLNASPGVTSDGASARCGELLLILWNVHKWGGNFW